MADNKILSKAKEQKNDEFYTQLSDIEKELRHYKEHFRGKVVFCNCDDPEESHFWKYFELNFEELGLKKLVATHFEREIPSYKLELTADRDGDGRITSRDIVKTPLRQNGDFRSPECIEILKEADIVVTNPPFSLFREFIAQLVEYNKKFVIIGRMSALHYKEIFPLIQNNIIWTGYGFNLSMVYRTPYENTEEANRKFVISKGYNPAEGYLKVPAICWYTNLDIPKIHENMILYRNYNAVDYPTYENYDAIDINKVDDIPCDYYGMMGVPDTFLANYNPQQFEIVGLGCGDMAKEIGISKNYRGRTDLALFVDGKHKCPYSRIIIRRKRDE